MAGSRNTLATLVCVGLVAAFAPAASVAADPIKDPNTIACPDAPAGWTNPPGTGKTVQSPQLDPTLATRGSSDQAEVLCDYFASPTRHVIVAVNYAVPDDINPINDFYWGCSSAVTKWTDGDRVFRIMSTDQWAIAGFADFPGALQPSDVPAFENVARGLLRNAEGYAHACTLTTQPTELTSNFHYTFEVAAGAGSGSFWVTLASGKASVVPVVQVTGVKIALKVKTNGVRHALTVKITRGIDFLPARPGANGKLRLAVQVVKSEVPSCQTRNTGTLTITTAPSVLLKVCSQTFLGGPARATIDLFY